MEAVMPSDSSHYDTEEKTEPFNVSEYLRLIAEKQQRQQDEARQDEASTNAPTVIGAAVSNIHLDELVVPSDRDIRLLVRPLTSRPVSPNRQESCEWVALRSERTDLAGADTESDDSGFTTETVLAVTQTSQDIKFTVNMPGEHHIDGTPVLPLCCELYYDPGSDNQILVNRGEAPISICRVYPSQTPLLSPLPSSSPSSSDGTPVPDDLEHTVNPGMTRTLSPGTWRIKMDDIEVLDLRILERRRPFFRSLPAPPTTDAPATTALGKRSFALVAAGEDADNNSPSARRQKVAATDDADASVSPNSKESLVLIIRPSVDPFVFPLPSKGTDEHLGAVGLPGGHHHALLQMGPDDTLVVPGELATDAYTLTKRGDIASSKLSTVFTGVVDDHPNVPSGSVVTVKVIKTRAIAPPRSPSPGQEQDGAVAAAAGQPKPHEHERRAVQQADMWKREVDQHGVLRHNSIVRLYAADARYLSLYMEHIDALDLSKRNAWRHDKNECFKGDRVDAMRILRDIAGALHYIHNLKSVHNDVKPGNILYSRARGAVLCDFGLSVTSTSQVSTGGTPYYVPPEFIGHSRRGPPGDVWALGITMLYVLGKIAFPDSRHSRQRPNPLYWQIAEVNAKSASLMPPPRGSTLSLPAIMQMQMWLAEVKAAKETLNRADQMERLTYEMLRPNPAQRITMSQVVKELYA